MGQVCRKALVSGKVQGVWYRASTKRRAQELGVTGWARNLDDGNVEVMMYGSAASVLQLEQWLKQGPPLARVHQVDCADAPSQAWDQFTTG